MTVTDRADGTVTNRPVSVTRSLICRRVIASLVADGGAVVAMIFGMIVPVMTGHVTHHQVSHSYFQNDSS